MGREGTTPSFMCVNLGVEGVGAQELLFSMGSESKENKHSDKDITTFLQHQNRMLFSHKEIMKKKNDEIKSSLSEQTNFSVAKSLEIMLCSMIGVLTVRETWHLKTQCLLLFYQQNKQEYKQRPYSYHLRYIFPRVHCF